MLRAIIVDDEGLSLKRLNKLLIESGEIEICDTFFSPLEAYEYVKSNKIDIAFLDISVPEISGMILSGLLLGLDSSIDIVFVTAYDDYAVQAFDMSALDYLMKPVTARRLSKTLDKIRKKHGITSKEVKPLKEILTEQEIRVLRLLASGLPNKEIADRLNISRETVKWHIKNMYRKFGVNNRVQALQHAEQLKTLE